VRDNVLYHAQIEALEDLAVDQHKAWKVAIGKIKKALGE
jgi:hypothetical protein